MQGDLFISESVLLFPIERLAGLIERTAQSMANSRAERGARAYLNRGFATVDIMCLQAGLSRTQMEEQELVFRDAVLGRLAELRPPVPEPQSADVISLDSVRGCR